jgi:hypothetical protein
MQIQKGSEMKTRYVLDETDLQQAALDFLKKKGLVEEHVTVEALEMNFVDSSSEAFGDDVYLEIDSPTEE